MAIQEKSRSAIKDKGTCNDLQILPWWWYHASGACSALQRAVDGISGACSGDSGIRHTIQVAVAG